MHPVRDVSSRVHDDQLAAFEVLTRLAPALEIRRAGFLEDRHEPPMFAMRDLRKDLDLALSFFREVNAPVPIMALTSEWVDEAAAEDGDLDISAVIRRYRLTAMSASV